MQVGRFWQQNFSELEVDDPFLIRKSEPVTEFLQLQPGCDMYVDKQIKRWWRRRPPFRWEDVLSLLPHRRRQF